MRLTVALRSPLTFRLPGPLTIDSRKAPPDTVAIDFEGREFVWHPPMVVEYEDEPEPTQYGPMVSVVLESEDESGPASESLQRFLSAASFKYEQPVEDVHYGGKPGSGETDAFNPHGTRTQKAYLTIRKADAPAGLEVIADETLWLALAVYREGINAGSPFYKCLAFRNVLDAVYEVEHEKRRDGTVTPEAARRDAFIEATAAIVANWYSLPTPANGWADYLRDEVRNSLAHVIRTGNVQVNPDDPADRERLRDDAPLVAQLAHMAIDTRWPNAVTAVLRDE